MEFGNLTPQEVACDVGLNREFFYCWIKSLKSEVYVILICATWFLLYKNDKCEVDAPKSLCMYPR